MFLTWISERLGWVSEKTWRRIAVGVIIVMASIQMFRVLQKPRGDFSGHWDFAQRLVAGLYLYNVNGLDLPYLPFWAVAHAPLTFLPLHAAQICLLPLFALAAFGLFRVLSRLSERHWAVTEGQLFWGTMLTIFLASRFLVRDILECGVNLALVALAWGAVWCWRQRKDWTGGTLLGFAIALKLTPALFLAWFVWKRQWKIAAATLVVTGLLMLSPILFMGREMFYSVHYVWWHHASRGLLAKNPVHGVLGEESIQNVGLRPALGRYLISLPEGHNARFDHPLAVQFFDFSPQTAGWIVRGLTALLLLGVAWKFRRKVQSREDASLLWEAAGVSVMILLLSPITWGQHCVGVIPALYFLIRQACHRQSVAGSTKLVLGVYAVFILLFNRELIGKQATYLLDSYYTTTWCLLGLLWLVLKSLNQEHAEKVEPSILPLPRQDRVQTLAS